MSQDMILGARIFCSACSFSACSFVVNGNFILFFWVNGIFFSG